jgi:hypothetical protein
MIELTQNYKERIGCNVPEESAKIEELLLRDWGGKWGEPLTPRELLDIGREALESLFNEPPLGPIPEYLRPHSSVHGCVTEYEEKLEELEGWKARKLNLWLRERVGRKYSAWEKVYELRLEKGKPADPEKYLFALIEDQT